MAVVAASNPVPIETTLPGWSLGNPNGQVEVRIFYDMLCPDSKQAHYSWKQLWSMPSPVQGKKYSDLVNMKVTPYVLPYHLHSFQMTQI